MEHILPCTCMWYKDQSMFQEPPQWFITVSSSQLGNVQEPPQWFITVSSSQLGNVLNIKITKINCVIINYVQVS
jgi:hypothetical protein